MTQGAVKEIIKYPEAQPKYFYNKKKEHAVLAKGGQGSTLLK